MLVETRVCDVCREGPAKTYQVRCEDREAETDLCVKHDGVLEGILKEHPARREGAKVPPARRGRRTPVTTIDEIEQRKKQR